MSVEGTAKATSGIQSGIVTDIPIGSKLPMYHQSKGKRRWLTDQFDTEESSGFGSHNTQAVPAYTPPNREVPLYRNKTSHQMLATYATPTTNVSTDRLHRKVARARITQAYRNKEGPGLTGRGLAAPALRTRRARGQAGEGVVALRAGVRGAAIANRRAPKQ